MSAGITYETMFDLGTVPLPRERRRYVESFELGLDRPSRYRDPLAAADKIETDALVTYGTDSWLSINDLVAREQADWRDERRCRLPPVRLPWEWAGRSVKDWLAVGLVVEEPGPDGARGWRLLSHERQYLEEGEGRNRRVVRVRGLPPEQQAARYALEQRRERTAATWDRKARNKFDDWVANSVKAILAADLDFVVPALWARSGMIEDGYVGARLDQAADIVRGAHHRLEMTRPRLELWSRILLNAESVAQHTPRAAEIVLPDDDADALDALI
ncbi:hypothetical protein [Methylobacterium mesophilicum]